MQSSEGLHRVLDTTPHSIFSPRGTKPPQHARPARLAWRGKNTLSMPRIVHPAAVLSPQPPMNRFDWRLKLLVVGDSSVGKTSLLKRFASGTFDQGTKATIGIDFKIHNMKLHGKYAQVQIWDTAGLERFRSITRCYFARSMGILLVFDVANRSSFTSLRFWMEQIHTMADAGVTIVLVGNKTDETDPICWEPGGEATPAATTEQRQAAPEQVVRGRKVTTQEGQALADEFGLMFFETSAKCNQRVDECFTALATGVTERLLHEARSAAPIASGTGRGLVDMVNPDDESEHNGCFSSCWPTRW